MISLNKKKTILTVEFNPKIDDIYGCNAKLSNINPIITIFKHEEGYRIVDPKGKFHLLNKQIKIKL